MDDAEPTLTYVECQCHESVHEYSVLCERNTLANTRLTQCPIYGDSDSVDRQISITKQGTYWYH